MTLNVNLEDVPWEILEAVRLRILAQRRAMEQSRLQRRPVALRPQAQFAKLGARADQRRLPEPAAILDSGNEEVAIVVWNTQVTTHSGTGVPASRTLTVSNAKLTASLSIEIEYPDYAFSSQQYANQEGFWEENIVVNPECTNAGFFSGVSGFIPEQGPVPPICTRVTRWRRQIKNTTDYGVNDSVSLAFPVDKTTSIFVWAENFRFDGVLITSENTFEQTYEFLGTDPSSGFLYYGERNTGVFSSNTERISTGLVENFYCFLVSANSVKQISAPPQLQNIIKSYMRAPNPDTRSITTNIVGSTGVTYWIYLNPNDTTQGAQFQIAGGSTELPPITYDQPFQDTTARDTFFDIYDTSGILGSYGLGNYDSSSFTPGIFAFLNDFDPPPMGTSQEYSEVYEPDGFWEDHTKYQFIRDTYFSDYPSPRKLLMPCVIDGRCNLYGEDDEARFISFDSTSRLPVSATAQLDLSSFRKETKTYPLGNILTGVDQLFYAWDWGRPNFCRRKLIALGFTPQDLTPTPPPNP